VPKPIEDEYGQELQVDALDSLVQLAWTEDAGDAFGGSPRFLYPGSKLSPADARELASQLTAAADEVEGVVGRG
jgi:hypothetical protein